MLCACIFLGYTILYYSFFFSFPVGSGKFRSKGPAKKKKPLLLRNTEVWKYRRIPWSKGGMKNWERDKLSQCWSSVAARTYMHSTCTYQPMQSVRPISSNLLLVSSYEQKPTTTVVELISDSLENTAVHQQLYLRHHRTTHGFQLLFYPPPPPSPSPSNININMILKSNNSELLLRAVAILWSYVFCILPGQASVSFPNTRIK